MPPGGAAAAVRARAAEGGPGEKGREGICTSDASEFDSQGGRLTLLPPVLGPSYRVLVPKADEDGLDIAGIRPTEIRVPLGTKTPRNVRAPGFRAPNLCGVSGLYIPFATTKAKRLETGDPRRSLGESPKDHEGYVRGIEHAAKKLMHKGFLLQEDADRFISDAEASNVLR